MRGFVTLRRIIEALRRAEEIKRELWYCQSLQKLGYCYCREGELCQTTLAFYLEISKEAREILRIICCMRSAGAA